MFRISTGGEIEERVLQKLMSGIAVSAEGLKNDLEDKGRQTKRHVTGGFRHSTSRRWSLLGTIRSMAANKSQNKEELIEKSRSEIHWEAQAADEEKNGMHCFNVRRR